MQEPYILGTWKPTSQQNLLAVTSLVLMTFAHSSTAFVVCACIYALICLCMYMYRCIYYCMCYPHLMRSVGITNTYISLIHVHSIVCIAAAPSSECAVNNGGCEVFCFSVPNTDGDGTQALCDCPTGIIINGDNRTCNQCKCTPTDVGISTLCRCVPSTNIERVLCACMYMFSCFWHLHYSHSQFSLLR